MKIIKAIVAIAIIIFAFVIFVNCFITPIFILSLLLGGTMSYKVGLISLSITVWWIRHCNKPDRKFEALKEWAFR